MAKVELSLYVLVPLTLLTEVYHGVTYVDGLRASTARKRRVAA